MKAPLDRISRVALIFIGLLLLFHIIVLVSQLFLGTRQSFSQPSYLATGFSVLVSLVFLLLFFVWRNQWPYLILALFFLWFSFTLKEVAGFMATEERVMYELLVTILRIIMCVLFAIGLLQGELRRLLVRSEKETVIER